jgi:hypothetical protein
MQGGRVSDGEGCARGRPRETPATEEAQEGTFEAPREPPRKKTRGGVGGPEGVGEGGASSGVVDTIAGGGGGEGGAGSFKILGGKGEVLARMMEDSSALWRARDVEALRAVLARDGYLLLRGILPRADVERGRTAALAVLAKEQPHLFVSRNSNEKKEKEVMKKSSSASSPSSSSPSLDQEDAAASASAASAAAAAAADGGLLVPGAANLGLLSRQHIAALPEVRAVVESPELFDLAEALLECAAADEEEDEEGEGEEEEEEDSSSSGDSDGGGGGGGAITTAYKWFRAVAGGEFTGVHTDRVFLGKGGCC